METVNELTAMLGIDTPIVLAPFGGLSSVELTATVSERGGLGSYGLYGYDAERIRSTVDALRAATARPFAVNLWLPTGTERDPSDAEYARALEATGPLFAEVGIEPPTRPERFLPSFDEQLQAVLDARPAVLSVVFGVPDAAVVQAAHERGIRVVGTATTVDEARVLAEGGVDAVVATGAEAAGHRVSFLEPADHSLVGTFALVPQVRDVVDIPVIAAGGVADRRGVAAALALGADGVQVGTAFLRTRQSAANDAHRAAIAETPAHRSVLTRAMSGRLARGASNRAIETLERADAIAPFPAQNWLTGRFRAAAGAQGKGELQSLWLGQASRLALLDDASAVFDELRAGLG
ncbi:NAD(P)H-dependent flavin oxidoreductase [Humibacter ginsenosidimutans]|uniref:Propionate 3-nitronate monooxygenase n=1 Tax=Humibacter ginsenosidimutans TaxID=2599293 RepID=A0A5B8M3J8_9MICO|nr:nitronate monooxygenase [Humibacter ginsenosidimutans]QDZ14721.1 2-nitropropane dioxygenase [Humibacter ginsenosidimutans]